MGWATAEIRVHSGVMAIGGAHDVALQIQVWKSRRSGMFRL